MSLFPDRIMADLAQLPGADHSFLKQISGPDGRSVRDGLDRVVAGLPTVVQDRIVPMLTSLDNRRFFQGYAEISVLSALGRGGWSAEGLYGTGPRLRLAGVDGANLALSVLAFVHQSRPGGDVENRHRLVEALGRVAGKHRFAVLIRRWLPHDFDPEPVRRAIEVWLQQVQAGAWVGRYAPYEDETVFLEFCLTGEKVKGRVSPLALALGPFYGHRALSVLEPRAVAEMDRHTHSVERDTPLLLACVSDQPWNISPGYLRDLLYGRASCTTTGEEGARFEFGGSPSVCAFRDPLYRSIAGVVMVDRNPSRPTTVRAEAWLNPWAERPLAPASLGVRAFARLGGTPDAPVMGWSAPREDLELR